MIEASFVSELPNVPAVYALRGGTAANRYVAYVGIADALRNRIAQHLVTRDSSVAVRTAATGINPDYVTQVTWWEHPDFSDRRLLRAAEVVAGDVLAPALRSRSRAPKDASALLDGIFGKEMEALFCGDPTGVLNLPTLQDVVEKLVRLEHRVSDLERRAPAAHDPAESVGTPLVPVDSGRRRTPRCS